MTDLEKTKQVIEKLYFDYKTKIWNNYIVMDVFRDEVKFCGVIFFNLDGSFKEEEKNDE